MAAEGKSNMPSAPDGTDVPRFSIPDLSESKSEPERALQLLRQLRSDTTTTDAALIVSGTEYPIHRCVVSRLSEFFCTALYGAFSETKSKKLVLNETSEVAVSILLDYAYVVDVSKSLDNFEVALDVWNLAHRYQIDCLRAKAVRGVMKSAKVKDCVRLLHHAQMYGTKAETALALNLISADLQYVFLYCPDFTELRVQDLQAVLSSKNLVASEMSKFDAVIMWAKANADVPAEEIERLISYVRFQRFESREQLQAKLSQCEVLPKGALLRALARGIRTSTQTGGFNEAFRGGKWGALDPLDWSTVRSTEFVCARESSFYPSVENDFYFSHLYWAMSAQIEWKDISTALDLSFDHGLPKRSAFSCPSGLSKASPYNLSDDIAEHEFKVKVKQIFRGSGFEHNGIYLLDTKQPDNTSYRLSWKCEVVRTTFLEIQTSVLVHIQSRKRFPKTKTSI